jgi:anthranilate phosphoribosyltransferase
MKNKNKMTQTEARDFLIALTPYKKPTQEEIDRFLRSMNRED